MRNRERTVHPIAQRCIDKSGKDRPYANLTEVAERNRVGVSFIHKLAKEDKLDVFVEKTSEWAAALGVKPEDFLAEVSRYIVETRKISKQQSKNAI